MGFAEVTIIEFCVVYTSCNLSQTLAIPKLKRKDDVNRGNTNFK